MNDRFKFRWFSKVYNKVFEVVGLEFPNFVIYKDEQGNEVETALSSDNGELIQCTGLKDKNGKLIFEGDIVKFKKIYKCACFTQEEEVLFKVIWEGYGFYLSQIKLIKGSVSYITGRRLTVILEKDTYAEHQTDISLEVVGNAYKNADLLESED